jgi:hypothetical protein
MQWQRSIQSDFLRSKYRKKVKLDHRINVFSSRKVIASACQNGFLGNRINCRYEKTHIMPACYQDRQIKGELLRYKTLWHSHHAENAYVLRNLQTVQSTTLWRRKGRGGIVPLFTGLVTRWRWEVSFTPRSLFSRGKKTRYRLYERLSGPQTRPVPRCLEKKLFSCRESNPVIQHFRHFYDWATDILSSSHMMQKYKFAIPISDNIKQS